MIPSWHQQNAAKRQWQTRNFAAHIFAPDYVKTGKTLCGRVNPAVWIDADKRSNPANRCCLICSFIADRL